MKDEYKREMERLGPRQEELERLYALMEGGTQMKWKKRLGRRAVLAIAACAALTLTAAAAAAPAVWETLREHLGVYAPYAQTIEGAVCADKGIEVQVLSAISDDLEARFYLAVRDVEEDRLNEFLTLTGRLTAGEEQMREGKDPSAAGGIGWPATSYFELVSYDPDGKTALFSARILYGEDARPTGQAQLAVTGMTTRQAELRAGIPCARVTGETLKSLSVGEDDKVIFRPGDVDGTGYTNAVLPRRQVVLAPGQTPTEIEGTEDVRVSSMGFADDGCFHIRLEFADGVKPGLYQDGDSAVLCSFFAGEEAGVDVRMSVFQETLVEGGMDVLFPLIKAEDLAVLQGGEVMVYGYYFRPGTEVEGSWSTDFEVEYYPSAVLDWTGEVNGCRIRQITISPLTVTTYSNDRGTFHDMTLYAVKQDGGIVTAEPGSGRYANMEAVGGEGYDAFNTWKFAEPVDVEDIVSLRLGDTVIPVK